jgi:nitrite reductase/ring-hydroxylating ferredoxin subunit
MTQPATLPQRRRFACSRDDLANGKVCVVPLAREANGLPREAIVLLDHAQTPRAYLNLCRHLPIPLDGLSRRFVVGGYLQCLTHGARYQIEDGLCVAGPCRGQSLLALELRLIGRDLFVVEP